LHPVSQGARRFSAPQFKPRINASITKSALASAPAKVSHADARESIVLAAQEKTALQRIKQQCAEQEKSLNELEIEEKRAEYAHRRVMRNLELEHVQKIRKMEIDIKQAQIQSELLDVQIKKKKLKIQNSQNSEISF
jgi:hypothetical protein